MVNVVLQFYKKLPDWWRVAAMFCLLVALAVVIDRLYRIPENATLFRPLIGRAEESVMPAKRFGVNRWPSPGQHWKAFIAEESDNYFYPKL